MSTTTTALSVARPVATESHLDVIRRLQGLIHAATASLQPLLAHRDVSLLDFPDHGNVGDSAIWLGEMAWLRSLGVRPSRNFEHRDPFSKLESANPTGPILLHGGGNFGDVWPNYQRFREKVMIRFAGLPIVQMPQSIHFQSASAASTAARAIGRAENFVLLVRDRESLEFARSAFDCETHLCPDMAFALGPLDRSAEPDLDVLLLLREDKEGVGHPRERDDLPVNWLVDDWLQDAPSTTSIALWGTRLRAVALPLVGWRRTQRRKMYFASLAGQRVRRGVAQLSRARYVITDRLHVHILSTLMGIPHCFLDNSYGKIRRFSSAFSTQWVGCSSAQTMDEAVEIARGWLATQGAAR